MREDKRREHATSLSAYRQALGADTARKWFQAAGVKRNQRVRLMLFYTLKYMHAYRLDIKYELEC